MAAFAVAVKAAGFTALASGINPVTPPEKLVGLFANEGKLAEHAHVTALSSVSGAEIFPPGTPRRVIMVMGLAGAADNTLVLRRVSDQGEIARLDVPAEHSSALTELVDLADGLEVVLEQPADDYEVRVWSEA